jgi:hypothetical protein
MNIKSQANFDDLLRGQESKILFFEFMVLRNFMRSQVETWEIDYNKPGGG